MSIKEFKNSPPIIQAIFLLEVELSTIVPSPISKVKGRSDRLKVLMVYIEI